MRYVGNQRVVENPGTVGAADVVERRTGAGGVEEQS